MAYTGNSIVDFLNGSGQASDFTSRSKLATQNGIQGYTGTAEQNQKLLGVLNKPVPTTSPAPTTGGISLSGNPALTSSGSTANNNLGASTINTSPTVKPAGSSVGLPNPGSTQGLLPTASTATSALLGATAAHPTDNVQKPDNTLSPAQTSSASKTASGTSNSAPTSTQTSTPAPTPTPTTTGTGGGLYGQLVNTLSTQGPSADYTAARANYDKINSDLATSRKNEADSLAANANNPIPLEFQQGRGQVLQNQYLGQQNAISGELQGASNVLGAANTQQGLLQQALGTAAGYAAPRQNGYVLLDPTTGQPVGGTGGANQAIINGANADSTYSFAQKYNEGSAKLRAADGIQNQIINTLNSNPTLNSQPITGITNLNELLSGQISSGPQQLLSQQIAQYIQTLGLDPATVANIAHQQTGTLAQLLDSLRQTAQTQNESYNPANAGSSGSSGTSADPLGIR